MGGSAIGPKLFGLVYRVAGTSMPWWMLSMSQIAIVLMAMALPSHGKPAVSAQGTHSPQKQPLARLPALRGASSLLIGQSFTSTASITRVQKTCTDPGTSWSDDGSDSEDLEGMDRERAS